MPHLTMARPHGGDYSLSVKWSLTCTVGLHEVGRFSMMATVLDTEDVAALTKAQEARLWEMGAEGLWEQRTGRGRETWQGPGYCPDTRQPDQRGEACTAPDGTTTTPR